MMKRVLGLILALGPVAGWAADADLGAWLKSRAQEQELYLESQAASPNGSMWRERPIGEPALPELSAPTSLAPLIRAVRPGVVNIRTVQSGAGRSLGSGFILTPDGFVVTNNHVIDRAAQIQVLLADGREFFAEVVGKDPSTDVALLKLADTQGVALPYSYLGDSDQLQVGDWVVAIGNPFGLDHSVAHGMISAKERVIGVGVFDDFIQTDALINPGNSGGPLFNMRGEVVGVTTAIISQGQGIGFSVPINMVKDLLPNLRVNGRLARGWLGVNIHDRAGEGLEPLDGLAARKGAVVREVFKNSPAASAGIKVGDRVTAVNGRPIETYLQLLRRVAILAPGSEAKLTLIRGTEPREVSVKLIERPSPEVLERLAGGAGAQKLGVVPRDLNPTLAERLGLASSAGVLVAGVIPGSPAEDAGLQAGDLITEVNRRRVGDTRSFEAAVQASNWQTALVRFTRGDTSRYVALRNR
jgi:serine protease Do